MLCVDCNNRITRESTATYAGCVAFALSVCRCGRCEWARRKCCCRSGRERRAGQWVASDERRSDACMTTVVCDNDYEREGGKKERKRMSGGYVPENRIDRIKPPVLLVNMKKNT